MLLCCASDFRHVGESGARQGAGDKGHDRDEARRDYHLQEGREGSQRQPRVRDTLAERQF